MSMRTWFGKNVKSDVFFIRGQPKSGTNWICRLLNLHPQVQATGQFHFEDFFLGLENTMNHPWSILKRNQALLHEEFYRMISHLLIGHCGNVRMCGDRTPEGILNATIPGKKCVYISRDGRDVLVSWTFHALRLKLHEHPPMILKQELFEKDPDYFEKLPQELLGEEGYLRHFAKNWNDKIVDDFKFLQDPDPNRLMVYHIRYEDLHSKTEHYRDEILQFLGVRPDKAQPLSDGTRPGFGRIDNTSFNRRGQPHAWREYFTDEQLRWYMEEAAEAIEIQAAATSGIAKLDGG